MRALGSSFSSGGPGIRGDGQVSVFRQLIWLSANGVSNLLGSVSNKELEICREPVFNQASVRMASRFARHASPTRLGCDLFWASIPWKQISSVVSQPRLVDFGCGTAIYGDYWNKLLPQGIGEYVGIDISAHSSWHETRAFPRRFVLGGHSGGAGVEADLYFSQSALEHFKDDLSFFRGLQETASRQETPSLQIHVVPSSHQVRNTGAHGWRAYSPTTLGRLVRLAPTSANVYLVGLGGVRTMDLYRRIITVPRIRRRIGLRAKDSDGPTDSLSVAIEDNLARSVSGEKTLFHSFAIVIDNGFNLDFHFRKVSS